MPKKKIVPPRREGLQKIERWLYQHGRFLRDEPFAGRGVVRIWFVGRRPTIPHDELQRRRSVLEPALSNGYLVLVHEYEDAQGTYAVYREHDRNSIDDCIDWLAEPLGLPGSTWENAPKEDA